MQFGTTEPGPEHPERLIFFLLPQFRFHREVRRVHMTDFLVISKAAWLPVEAPQISPARRR